MKRGDLLRLLASNDCILHRHGSRHDIYTNRNGKKAPVPRHTEVKDSLVRLILKQLEVEK
jgi:mRNA interferase HicA